MEIAARQEYWKSKTPSRLTEDYLLFSRSPWSNGRAWYARVLPFTVIQLLLFRALSIRAGLFRAYGLCCCCCRGMITHGVNCCDSFRGARKGCSWCSSDEQMRLQIEAIPFFQLQAPTPRCHRPQRLLSAATGSRSPASKHFPSEGQETWGIGGISYPNDICRRGWAGQAESSNARRSQRCRD